jgi:hypothetical protein
MPVRSIFSFGSGASWLVDRLYVNKFFALIFGLASLSIYSQECRAVSDCSSGRCISTVVCDRPGEVIKQAQPSPSRLPERTIVTLQTSNPDSGGRVTLVGRLQGTSRIVEIRINNIPIEAAVRADGSFTVERALRVGSNEFQLTALDEFGRLSSATTYVYRSDEVKAEFVKLKRLALVIGNSNYRDSPLVNPINDADDISKLLTDAGFDVINLRDASISQMRSSLRTFGDRLIGSDAGMFYFAGHATEVNGKNYLLPIGSDIKREDEIPDQSLDLGAILDKIDVAKKSSVIIIDACRNNPFARSFRTTASGLTRVDSPSGTLIAFATSPGRVAADGNGRNSPFTKSLIQELRQRNTPIEQVLKNVRRKVIEETRGGQVPWETTSLVTDYIVVR